MKQVLASIVFGFVGSTLIGQTPGAIFYPTSTSVTAVNPNGDAWVTTSGGAFSSDDQTESEINWTAIPQDDAEPSGDLSSGGACGTTDIMDDFVSGSDASYIYFSDPDGTPDNGDEYLMYRLRIANDPGNGNFGFSVLMDIDAAFGTGNDSDALVGNPGFEIEVRVKNGGATKGVYLDDVNGATSGTTMVFYSLANSTQRSYALSTNATCDNRDPVFYDFYIPMSDLTTYFGVTSSTAVRIVGATSVNGGSALSKRKSDIAGINDDNYSNSIA